MHHQTISAFHDFGMDIILGWGAMTSVSSSKDKAACIPSRAAMNTLCPPGVNRGTGVVSKSLISPAFTELAAELFSLSISNSSHDQLLFYISGIILYTELNGILETWCQQ